MTEPRITLTLNDGRGTVAVESARFTIGHSNDNDLAIDDPRLSRRHALIEKFDGIVQISDCGSESGTFVNDRRINGGAVLRNGDTISMGSVCKMLVSIRSAGPEIAVAKDNNQHVASNVTADVIIPRLATPVIAIASVLLILLIAVPLIVFLNKESGNRASSGSNIKESQGEGDKKRAMDLPRQEIDRNAVVSSDAASKSVTIEEVEKAAVQFMRRISSDDKPYVFPPNSVSALGDIRKRVEQYSQTSAIVTAFNSMTTAAQVIAAEARREGIEPGLVIMASLAESEGARTPGDQMAAARRILPVMLSLRKTLGTESADKSLILIAAYRMGGGTKKSHPLLHTLTRAVKNPLTDRNVWFLRERGSLDDEAYNFVVNFLALGLIAENPRRFNIAAPPVAY